MVSVYQEGVRRVDSVSLVAVQDTEMFTDAAYSYVSLSRDKYIDIISVCEREVKITSSMCGYLI